MPKKQGWRKEPARHALASIGVKTTQRQRTLRAGISSGPRSVIGLEEVKEMLDHWDKFGNDVIHIARLEMLQKHIDSELNELHLRESPDGRAILSKLEGLIMRKEVEESLDPGHWEVFFNEAKAELQNAPASTQKMQLETRLYNARRALLTADEDLMIA